MTAILLKPYPRNAILSEVEKPKTVKRRQKKQKGKQKCF